MNKSYSKIRHINNVNLILENRYLNEGEESFGNFKVDLNNGPANHLKRTIENNMESVWVNTNAWDLFAPIGTKVYSYTKGTVVDVVDSGNVSGPVYGIAIKMTGIDGYPDSYYAHMSNVKLKVGDVVEVGDYLGEVAKWVSYPQWSHTHVALKDGYHLKNYISKSISIGEKPIDKMNQVSNPNFLKINPEKMYPKKSTTYVSSKYRSF